MENQNDNYIWQLENEVDLFTLDLPAFTVKNSLHKQETNQEQGQENINEMESTKVDGHQHSNSKAQEGTHYVEQTVVDAVDRVILKSIRREPMAMELFSAMCDDDENGNGSWIHTIFSPESITETRYVEVIWRQALAAVINFLTLQKDNTNGKATTEFVDTRVVWLHKQGVIYRGFRNSTDLQAGIMVYIATEMVRRIISEKTHVFIDAPVLPEPEMKYEVFVFFGYAIRKCRDIAFHKRKFGFSRNIYKEIYQLLVALGSNEKRYVQKNHTTYSLSSRRPTVLY
jgi:hypothetical protein